MKKSTVYTKSQVKNMLEFDKYNNVVIYVIANADNSLEILQCGIFNSYAVAKDWFKDLCPDGMRNGKKWFITTRTLRLY